MKTKSNFLILVFTVLQCFCFATSTFASNVNDANNNPKIDMNTEPETRVRSTYLQNANRTMAPVPGKEDGQFNSTIDSVALVYGRVPGCPYASYEEENIGGLVLHLSLLAYKNQGKHVKLWGDEMTNGIVYENCNFDENNKSNIILAIFNEHNHLLYKTNLNLIQKGNYGVGEFYDLGVDIRADVLKNIRGKSVIVRFYKDNCNENNINENLLSVFCGGTHDPYFEL